MDQPKLIRLKDEFWQPMSIVGADGNVDPGFLTSVGLGKVPGVSYIRKFAYIPNLQAITGERDLWEYGSTDKGDINYTYPADGSAPINTVSSSNAVDAGNLIVQGLDINGLEVIQEIILDGQNKVVLSIPLWRCYRMVNNSPSSVMQRGIGFQGEVFCYEDTPIVGGVPTDKSKIKAYVNNGNNSSLMSMYTIPADKIGLFLNVEPRTVKKGNATIIFNAYVRDFGLVARKVDVGALSATGTSTFSVRNDVPVLVGSNSDILLTADVDTNNTGASLIMYILLFDKVIWGL